MSSRGGAAVACCSCSLPPALLPCAFLVAVGAARYLGRGKRTQKWITRLKHRLEVGWVVNSVNLRPIFGYWSSVGVSLTHTTQAPNTRNTL
jgi:hypothetical protein